LGFFTFSTFHLLNFSTFKFFTFKKRQTMKKETWKTILQVVVSILTAAITTLGTTSCMGHGPIQF
jgi:hypothetical protein